MAWQDEHWNKLLWHCADNDSYKGCFLPEKEEEIPEIEQDNSGYNWNEDNKWDAQPPAGDNWEHDTAAGNWEVPPADDNWGEQPPLPPADNWGEEVENGGGNWGEEVAPGADNWGEDSPDNWGESSIGVKD